MKKYISVGVLTLSILLSNCDGDEVVLDVADKGTVLRVVNSEMKTQDFNEVSFIYSISLA